MNTYASAGTVDITPEAAVPLAGSEIRTSVFQGVADHLEANALVLRQDGPPVVFVSLDLAFVGLELRTEVLRRMGSALSEDSLFFAASHTHFAPATDDRRPRLGRMDPGYFEQLCRRVSDLVARLLEDPGTPVTIDYLRGEADHAVNRRMRAGWHLSRRGALVGAVVAAPNLAGPRDESVHLLRISRTDARPLATIWSYACHPVAFPRPLEVSSDYPGRVRRRLRHVFGPDLPVLFWQGFAGDIRPRELDRSTSLRSHAKRVLLGPRFGRFQASEWDNWADSLARRVAGTASLGAGRAVSGVIQSRRVSRPLAEFVLGAGDRREVTFHGVMFGEDLVVLGISAEVVAEYGPLVRSAFEGRVSIPVGYIDEVYGYLPTARMLEEGGYEVSWFLRPFGLNGPLHPEIERNCTRALQELAAALTTSSTAARE